MNNIDISKMRDEATAIINSSMEPVLVPINVLGSSLTKITDPIIGTVDKFNSLAGSVDNIKKKSIKLLKILIDMSKYFKVALPYYMVQTYRMTAMVIDNSGGILVDVSSINSVNLSIPKAMMLFALIGTVLLFYITQFMLI